MGSTADRLNIHTEKLASAATGSAATQAASAPAPLMPPPPGGASLLDIALSATATSVASRVATETAADAAVVATQTTGLTESPAAIVQQDGQAAADMGKHASTFPMPGVKPPIGPPDTGIVRSASYSPAAPKQGPWDLEDGEWELDEWGSPQPVWPNFGGGGASSSATGHAPI